MADEPAKPRLPAAEKRRLVRFYAIAFEWTWALWIPALVWSAMTGSPLPSMDAGFGVWAELSGAGLIFAVAFQLAVYGPLVAAVSMLLWMRRAGDATALSDWRSALVRFRVPPRWWLFIAVWPVALGVLVLVASGLLGGGMPVLGAAPALAMVPVLLGIQLVTSGLEEPGWRGFALPLLQRTHNAEEASWYLGLMWAAWHLPYVIYLNREAPAWSLPLTIAGFGMSIIAMGYVHAWVYNSTGSLPLNIGLHAWANVTNTIVALVMPSPVVPLTTAGFTWLFVAWLFKRYGKERLAVEPAVAPARP